MINGAHGPYDASIPGSYGRNAAHNSVQTILNARTQAELGQAIRYSPEDAPVGSQAFYDNLFGFSETMTHLYDRENKGGINRQEFHTMANDIIRSVSRSYGLLGGLVGSIVRSMGGSQIDRIFRIQDRNRDGKIDVVEGAANTLLMDDSVSLLTARFPTESRSAQYQAGRIRSQSPSRLDGVITDAEKRFGVQEGYLNRPDLAGEALDEILAAHRLRERYEAFRKPVTVQDPAEIISEAPTPEREIL